MCVIPDVTWLVTWLAIQNPWTLVPASPYTLQEKADILEFGKLQGLRAAAKAFKVGFSTVQGWSKMDFSAQKQEG